MLNASSFASSIWSVFDFLCLPLSLDVYVIFALKHYIYWYFNSNVCILLRLKRWKVVEPPTPL